MCVCMRLRSCVYFVGFTTAYCKNRILGEIAKKKIIMIYQSQEGVKGYYRLRPEGTRYVKKMMLELVRPL